LWFTENKGNKIGKISPTTGDITEYEIPTVGSGVLGITTGPDGNLWFTELQGDKIGKISPMTGDITEYPIEN
jgi:virginiamycin B lyase